MNNKALKTLEYDKIIHRLTEHAASAGAKERCEKLQPSSSLWEIERAQTQTADALRRVYQKGSVSFGGIRDIRGSIKRLQIGGILGMGELRQIMSLLEKINDMGTTILVVTHERELVNRFGKRVVAIESGRIISDAAGGYYGNG